MDTRQAKAFELLFRHEGGYSNNPKDPGGATNFGVSIAYLQRLGKIDPRDGYLLGDMDHDGDIDIVDIQLMDKDEATFIYESQWWSRYRYGEIKSLPLAAKLLDLSVNYGPGRAHKHIQEAINRATGARLRVDGQIGDMTLWALNVAPVPLFILSELKLLAVDYYRSLNQTTFIHGWLRRALDDLEA